MTRVCYNYEITLLLQNEPAQSPDLDFESLVLRRLRQAEERKRLIEEIQEEDDKNM